MTDWQPGDPLHTSDGVFVRPMFSLIDDSTGHADSARWPVPMPHDDLGDE